MPSLSQIQPPLGRSAANWGEQMHNVEDMDDGDDVGTQMLSKQVLTNAMMPTTQEMVEMNRANLSNQLKQDLQSFMNY